MRQKVLSKETIIEISEDIIKNEGLDSLTTRRLSKEAHCALGTIYNYFPSREDLLLDVFLDSWTKTERKLTDLLKEPLELKQKVMKMFRLVDEDIKNRGGIGEYLISSFKSKNVDAILNRIIPILVSLLKQSKKTNHMDDETLEINAKWIYFGSLYMRKRDEKLSLFYNQVIDLFF